MDFLTNRYIEGESFKTQDYSKREFTFKEIVDTQFVRCDFAEAFFNECRFSRCTFTKCDLSMLKVKSSRFSDVQFESCKAIGINWTEASWAKSGFFRLIDFDDCAINYSSFFGLKLKKMRLTNCVAHEVDFGEADLTEAVFTGTDLTGSIFMHTTLTGADFVGAANYSISPALNTLKKTRFALPEAMSLLYNLDIIIAEPP